MNILFAKNNTKKTVVVNDIPTMPAIAPGETINLLEFATASELKKSATLPLLFDNQYLIEVKPQSEAPEPEVEEEEEEYEEILDEDGRIKDDLMPKAFDALVIEYAKTQQLILKTNENIDTTFGEIGTWHANIEKSISDLITSTKQNFAHYDTMIQQVASKDPQIDMSQISQQMSVLVDDKIKIAVTKSSQAIVTKVLEKILPHIKQNEAKIESVSNEIESISNEPEINIPELKTHILSNNCQGMNLKNISPGELKQVVELIIFTRRETDFKVKNIHISFELD